MTLRASTRPAEPGAATEPGSASRSGMRRGRSRAAHSPLPLPVLALGVLGACTIVLPFVGLGTRVAWTELPTLLTSQAATRALGLSLRTCAIATAISVCLGVPLALLLARQWRGVRVGRVLAVLPMTMPPVVAGIALLATLGKRGLLGRTLSVMDVQISFTTTAVVIAQVFVAMPYLVVTLEAALRSRDTHVEMIARTLGAGPWTLLTRITLPLVGPALARGTALALGRSLGEFGATIAFAGSKEGVTRTMPLAIYLERENDTATSLALAVVLIAMSFLIVGATNISWPELLRRLPHPSHPSRRARASSPHSTATARPAPSSARTVLIRRENGTYCSRERKGRRVPAVSPGMSLVYAVSRVVSRAPAAPDPRACRNLRIREVGALRRVGTQAPDLRGHCAHKAWDGVGSALILRLRQNIRPAPPGQDRRREADHSQNPLHDVLTQQLLPADVVVQRRGGHTEAPGQIAHRPRIEPSTARGLDGDVDNRRRRETDVVGPVGSGPGHQLLTPP